MPPVRIRSRVGSYLHLAGPFTISVVLHAAVLAGTATASREALPPPAVPLRDVELLESVHEDHDVPLAEPRGHMAARRARSPRVSALPAAPAPRAPMPVASAEPAEQPPAPIEETPREAEPSAASEAGPPAHVSVATSPSEGEADGVTAGAGSLGSGPGVSPVAAADPVALERAYLARLHRRIVTAQRSAYVRRSAEGRVALLVDVAADGSLRIVQARADGAPSDLLEVARRAVLSAAREPLPEALRGEIVRAWFPIEFHAR